MSSAPQNNELRLSSSEFKQNATIPEQYTCRGEDISPPLNISGVPDSAKSLALIMHDPDALGSDFVHWLIWDIPPRTETIAANSVPVGAMQGPNGFGASRYGGPCPPAGSGTHRYMFELYALDTTLNLGSEPTREALQDAMQGHILKQYTLTGLVAAGS